MKKMIAMAAMMLLVCALHAQEKRDTFQTKSVSVFKNGSAFFVKSGKVKTEKGRYLMTEKIPTSSGEK
jgi:hypothetical protein